MAGKIAGYFGRGLVSFEPLEARTEAAPGAAVTVVERGQSRCKVSATGATSGRCKVLSVLSVLFLLVISIAVVFLSSFVCSAFRQMQFRIAALERRVEYLEVGAQSYEDDAVAAEDAPHPVPSPEWEEEESEESVGRVKRNLRKVSRTRSKSPKNLPSIHMEMVSGPQRRKRKNSNHHILWKVSAWVPQKSRESFKVTDSEIAEIGVKQKGLYFIYAQIVFRNLGTNNIISIKSKDREFTRCYDGVDFVGDASEKLKTCYTGTVAMIEADETITVSNLYGHEIHNESLSNFFGLIKLADVR